MKANQRNQKTTLLATFWSPGLIGTCFPSKHKGQRSKKSGDYIVCVLKRKMGLSRLKNTAPNAVQEGFTEPQQQQRQVEDKAPPQPQVQSALQQQQTNIKPHTNNPLPNPLSHPVSTDGNLTTTEMKAGSVGTMPSIGSHNNHVTQETQEDFIQVLTNAILPKPEGSESNVAGTGVQALNTRPNWHQLQNMIITYPELARRPLLLKTKVGGTTPGISSILGHSMMEYVGADSFEHLLPLQLVLRYEGPRMMTQPPTASGNENDTNGFRNNNADPSYISFLKALVSVTKVNVGPYNSPYHPLTFVLANPNISHETLNLILDQYDRVFKSYLTHYLLPHTSYNVFPETMGPTRATFHTLLHRYPWIIFTRTSDGSHILHSPHMYSHDPTMLPSLLHVTSTHLTLFDENDIGVTPFDHILQTIVQKLESETNSQEIEYLFCAIRQADQLRTGRKPDGLYPILHAAIGFLPANSLQALISLYSIDLNDVDGEGETVLVKAIKLASLPWGAWSHNFTTRRGDWDLVFQVLTGTNGVENKGVRESLLRVDRSGFLPINWAKARGLRENFGLKVLEGMYGSMHSNVENGVQLSA